MQELAVLVICWTVWALPTAWIAQRKGRRFWDWFTAGLMLGIFGIPYVLLSSGDRLAQVERRIRNPERR